MLLPLLLLLRISNKNWQSHVTNWWLWESKHSTLKWIFVAYRVTAAFALTSLVLACVMF